MSLRAFYVSGANFLTSTELFRRILRLVSEPTVFNAMKHRPPNPTPALAEWHLAQRNIPTYLRGAQRKKYIRAISYTGLFVAYNTIGCILQIVKDEKRATTPVPAPRDWEIMPQEGVTPDLHGSHHGHGHGHGHH
eukprot:TRINITY_DN17755_c0_g1_i1.p1 TRINITY_DN17755_c0_g1~~TRINITY_DN17755_c0_g1_i1.p1  ORF type:complete len:135 (-),score=6.93 TRINITY_DN17755_c0_g1_i1:91-495(-)